MPRPSPTVARLRRNTPWLVLSGLAVLAGVAHAVRLSWVTDDAYISYRYAENLVHGHGLVFNVGERVEGYSNFLWTLWCALGIAWGFSPERWSTLWGVAAYGASLALLAWFAGSRARANARDGVSAAAGDAASAWSLPVAAWLGAVHGDWATFATSGLETSAFTLAVVAGYLLLLHADGNRRRAAAAGLALALVALSRPDGVLFAGLGGMYLILTSRRRRFTLVWYALPLVVVLAPYAWWKLAYYGDILPNTYYAKSANRAWYSQGLVYVGLYFSKYWVLALGVAGALVAWRSRATVSPRVERAVVAAAPAAVAEGPPTPSWSRAAALALAFALIYTWYVAHVGGDFMYARLMIPATPFYLILLELAIERLAAGRRRWRLGVAAVAIAAVAWTPYPFHGEGWVRGIVNEREFYIERDRTRAREYGERLARYFDGLPIHMAFCGGQAILAYYSRAPVAIETATGLTDSVIAHQPITTRGRVGHEKSTPVPYLLSRGTHFWMYTGSVLSDRLAPYIPLVSMRLDTLDVMVLEWDPVVMATLERRGARVDDFLGTLDAYLRTIHDSPEDQVRAVYETTKTFYFDHANDPAREAPFMARLGPARRPAR